MSIGYQKGTAAEIGYFFTRNGQGDIIGVYRSSDSKLIGTYEYDLWGKLISVKEASSGIDTNSILTKNPFRYRGYYYDNETGFYYLNARYYDSSIRRFISADDIEYLGINGSVDSYNLFAYCGNNPVMGYDPEGTFDFWGMVKGVGRVVTGVTAVAAGVAVCVGGAPVVMLAAAAVTITAGVLTSVNGVADIQQSFTGNNFVRDNAFKGKQSAYNIYSGATEVTAIIGTAVCGNYLSTNCTMRGAVPGTSVNQLALPPSNTCNLTSYVVNRPLTVSTGIVAPCSWGTGGGIQYFSWMSVDRLIKFGFLTPLE